MSADSLIPTDKEIQAERERRRRLDAEPPFRNPPPATLGELLTACEYLRSWIMARMREGERLLPGTDDNFMALLLGRANGVIFPSFERLWHGATILDLPAVPPFPGEPQTALEALAALDSLIAWCKQRQQGPPAAIAATPAPARNKRRGRKPPLEQSSPPKANLYHLIFSEHQRDEEYVITARRLKERRDVVELAKKAGLSLNSKTVRKALACMAQRDRRKQQTNKSNPS